MKIWDLWVIVVGRRYAQKVAVIPSFLHNPPLVYNHTPLLYIVKTSPFEGLLHSLTIDFARFFKSDAELKCKDMHRTFQFIKKPIPHFEKRR